MPAQPSPARLEAFSDGVMAVIITIMVLEFKVPRQDGMAGFLTILPTLAVYLLSFTFTAIYWVNHHHLIDRLKHIDRLILYSNLVFLFFLSLLPFFTDYLVQKHINSFSTEIYCTSLLVTGVAFGFLSMAIERHLARSGQIETPAEAALLAAELRKNLLLARLQPARYRPRLHPPLPRPHRSHLGRAHVGRPQLRHPPPTAPFALPMTLSETAAPSPAC